jgi:hypothetical protein
LRQINKKPQKQKDTIIVISSFILQPYYLSTHHYHHHHIHPSILSYFDLLFYLFPFMNLGGSHINLCLCNGTKFWKESDKEQRGKERKIKEEKRKRKETQAKLLSLVTSH